MIGLICHEPIAKIVIGTNEFGQEFRLGLCAKHLPEYLDPANRARIRERAYASWPEAATVKPESMLGHPTQRALVEHEEFCEQCAAVRDWTIREAQAGRTSSREDTQRIGEYSVAHCCPIGLQLRYEVGKVMMGLA